MKKKVSLVEKYDMKDPYAMVMLAQRVQTFSNVGYDFYCDDNDDEMISYSYFWEVCQEMVGEKGKTSVIITDTYKVEFK